jgi:hypothetical protein
MAELRINSDEKTGRISLKVLGNPLVLVLGLVFLLLLIFVLGLSFVRFVQGYAAYEGRVESIEDDWIAEWFGDDGASDRRVSLVTDDGRTLIRFINDQTLILHRIEVGDTIVKESGFLKKPYARDKKTVYQLNQELQTQR